MTNQDLPDLESERIADRAAGRDEAEAQSEQTIMPWVWGGVGLVVVAVFVAWAIFIGPHSHIRQPPAAAPLTRPPAQTY
jgi:hypothetical protein